MKVTIVAEIGSNWEGSVTKAKKLFVNVRRLEQTPLNFRCGEQKIFILLLIQIGKI